MKDPTVACVPPEQVLKGAPNFRDLGGLLNADGRPMRRGVVFRSEVLSSVGEGDEATLAQLDIGSVFDLRNPSERVAAPTVWPTAAQAVVVQVMPEELIVPGADLRQFIIKLRAGTLDVQHVSEMMLTTYRTMPSHFSAMLRLIFKTLAADDGRAALVHCTAGKDRTGFVCAMLLSALDVPHEAIVRNYLESARFYSTQRLLDQLQRLAGQPLQPGLVDAMAELAQVKASYLEIALSEVARGWGSVPAYLMQEAGLDEAMRMRLQRRLLG